MLNFNTIIEDAQTTPITEAAKSAVGVLTTETLSTDKCAGHFFKLVVN
jgi:hypothetical protein